MEGVDLKAGRCFGNYCRMTRACDQCLVRPDCAKLTGGDASEILLALMLLWSKGQFEEI